MYTSYTTIQMCAFGTISNAFEKFVYAHHIDYGILQFEVTLKVFYLDTF